MSTQSYSSIGAGRRRGTAHDDIDRSFYTVGQTLASIVNDPRAPSQSGGFWGLAADATQQLPPPAPPLDPAKYPPVSKADLQRYIGLVHGAYEKFVKDRQSLEAFDAAHQGRRSSERLSSGSSSSQQQQQQGEPFLVAVQAVPAQFFQEGFFDSWDDFFKQYCQEQSVEELYDQIDLLNRNLDVVELQLLREVASRSSSFFQAASTLQGLQGQLSEAVGCIRGLRTELAEADASMYSTAATVKGLQARRENLQDTLDITKGLEEVVAVQQALDVLLESQDYAGALELIDQLKALLQQPQMMGLQCLRHLPPRLMDVAAAVDGALANEFLSTVTNPDVGSIAAQAAADAEAHPDASMSPDGSVASAATWHLPDSSPSTAGAGASADEQLQEKLLPLAVGLYRAGALGPTLQQYKTNAGEEVKGAVREVVQQVLPVLLSACGDGLPQQPGPAGEGQIWEQLQLLHHGAFMVLLYAAARAIISCMHHTVRVGRVLEAILAGVNIPRSEYGPPLKACIVAVQVAADVGLGRWVKLLNARSAAHTRLKQYELQQILDLSEQVAEVVESVGARPLSSFRMALQGQCKALLDASHARCMTQLQGLLEAEQWVAVDVPAGFQAIVDRLLVRCAEGAALLEGREVPAGSSSLHTRSSSTGGGSQASRSSAAGDAAAAAAGSAPGAGAAAAGNGGEGQQAVLHLCGKSFHLVNAALMLLKMVDEYLALHDLMPQFGAEIIHRQLELLKLFNSQTAALVLGAGAMRTAGLRSISAKQLALSCQAIGMLSTLLAPLRAGCLALVTQPRRALLMPEYDRLLQDLTLHIDEVHSKLVDIMRDRLAAAMQALPAEVRAAAPSGGAGGSGSSGVSVSAPTPTIALLTKQLGMLRGVLVPLLLKEEVEFVFGAVSRSYSDALSDTFEALLAEPNSGWEPVVQVNALTMLEAFRELPLDPARSNNYSARLTTTYTKHFGLPPWDQQRLGHKLAQPAASSSSPQQDGPPAAASPPQQLDRADVVQEEQQQQAEQQPQQLQQQEQAQQQLDLPLPPAAAAAGVAAAAVAASAAGQAELLGDAAADPLEAAPHSNSLDPAAAAAGVAEQQPPQASLQLEELPKQHQADQVQADMANPQPLQQQGSQAFEQQQQQQQWSDGGGLLQEQGEGPLSLQQDLQLLQLGGQELQLEAPTQLPEEQQQPPSPLSEQPTEDGAVLGAATNGAAAADADAVAADDLLLLGAVDDSIPQQQEQQQRQEGSCQLFDALLPLPVEQQAHMQPPPPQQQQLLPADDGGVQQLQDVWLGDTSSSSSTLQPGPSNGVIPHDAAAAEAAAAAVVSAKGGEADLVQGLEALSAVSQPATESSSADGAASPAAAAATAAAAAAAAGEGGLLPSGSGPPPTTFLEAPPSAAAFMDAPPASAFMDAPPAFMEGPPAFMDAPPATAAAFMDAPPPSSGSELLGDLAGLQLGGDGEAAGAGAAGVGGGEAASPLDLLDAELQSEGEAVGGADVLGSAAAHGVLGASQPPLLQQEEGLVQLGQQQQQPVGAAGPGDTPGAAVEQDASLSLHDSLVVQPHPDTQPQQQPEQQQPEQQQLEQQQQPRPARRSLERPVPEFYASLLQPEGPADADAAGSMPPFDTPFERAAAAGHGADADQAGGTAAAAAVAPGPPVTSDSWDPLGAVTSAPPPEAAG